MVIIRDFVVGFILGGLLAICIADLIYSARKEAFKRELEAKTAHPQFTESQFLAYAAQNGWEVGRDKETEEIIAKSLKGWALREYRESERERKEKAIYLIQNHVSQVLGHVQLTDSQIQQRGEGHRMWNFAIGDLEFVAHVGSDDKVRLYLPTHGDAPVSPIDCLADLGKELTNRKDTDETWTKV